MELLAKIKETGSLNRFLAAWTPLAVLLIGLGFNVVLYQFSVESVRERQRVYFDFRAREAVERIESRMATYQQVLRGAAGIFDSYEEVSREEFRNYANRQALEAYFPGIQGIGFAQAIAPKDLQTHITAVRAQGFPYYSVQPPGQRDLYSSIVYLEPFSGRNLRAFGFDMYSEPVRRTAMQRSVDTGEMALRQGPTPAGVRDPGTIRLSDLPSHLLSRSANHQHRRAPCAAARLGLRPLSHERFPARPFRGAGA